MMKMNTSNEIRYISTLLSIRDEVVRRLECINVDDPQVSSALAELNDLLLDKLDELREHSE